jgi:uncharacterized DUF497 family protein
METERFIWDERKRAANLRKHGVDFAIMEHFEFDTAVIRIDDRRDYGEVRHRAFGMIDGRLHVLVFTARGAQTRVISLRRANDKERSNYAETQEDEIDC